MTSPKHATIKAVQTGTNKIRVQVLRITGCAEGCWYARHVGGYVPLLGIAPRAKDFTSAASFWRRRDTDGIVKYVDFAHGQMVHTLVSPSTLKEWPFKGAVPLDRGLPHADTPAGLVPQAQPRARHSPGDRAQRGQSRAMSATEAGVNQVSGFVLALAITAYLFPELSLAGNLAVTSIFTAASLVRSFGVRRLFNWLQTRSAK